MSLSDTILVNYHENIDITDAENSHSDCNRSEVPLSQDEERKRRNWLAARESRVRRIQYIRQLEERCEVHLSECLDGREVCFRF